MITQNAYSWMFGVSYSWPLLVCRIWRGPPVAAMGAWRTFAGDRDQSDIIGCSNKDHSDVVGAVISGSIVTEELL